MGINDGDESLTKTNPRRFYGFLFVEFCQPKTEKEYEKSRQIEIQKNPSKVFGKRRCRLLVGNTKLVRGEKIAGSGTSK